MLRRGNVYGGWGSPTPSQLVCAGFPSRGAARVPPPRPRAAGERARVPLLRSSFTASARCPNGKSQRASRRAPTTRRGFSSPSRERFPPGRKTELSAWTELRSRPAPPASCEDAILIFDWASPGGETRSRRARRRRFPWLLCPRGWARGPQHTPSPGQLGAGRTPPRGPRSRRGHLLLLQRRCLGPSRALGSRGRRSRGPRGDRTGGREGGSAPGRPRGAEADGGEQLRAAPAGGAYLARGKSGAASATPALENF